MMSNDYCFYKTPTIYFRSSSTELPSQARKTHSMHPLEIWNLCRDYKWSRANSCQGFWKRKVERWLTRDYPWNVSCHFLQRFQRLLHQQKANLCCQRRPHLIWSLEVLTYFFWKKPYIHQTLREIDDDTSKIWNWLLLLYKETLINICSLVVWLNSCLLRMKVWMFASYLYSWRSLTIKWSRNTDEKSADGLDI